MKRLALDSDGFLSNFTWGALAVVKEVTGRQYAETDVTMFDFAKSLGLSAEEARAVKNIIGTRQGFCASLPPYPGARDGVRRLREFGHVFCVTTPWDSNIWWRSERESWLALHIGIDEVEHKVDKSDTDADVFVDDKASHVRDWLIKHPDGCGVFWQTLHNTSEPVPYGAHVIGNFDALYHVVREHFRGPVQRSLPLASVEESP